MDDIVLEDSTLSMGERAPGIVFDKETKVKIYEALVDIGVKWIEIGTPSLCHYERKSLEVIKDMAQSDKVVVLPCCQGTLEDIKDAISLGFKTIHIHVPEDFKNAERSPNWMFEQVKDLVSYSKDNDVFVSISAPDIARTDSSLLVDFSCFVEENGADRLRLSDSTGKLLPAQFKSIVENIKNKTDIDLQSDARNDFGLAVANTLAAIEGGVKYIHVTINGIGERAGATEFSQIVMIIHRLLKQDIGIELQKLTELSNLISKYTQVHPHPFSPVIGSKIFMYTSETFEPFPPEAVGGKREILLGKHSNKNTIRHKLQLHGIHEVPDNSLISYLRELREKLCMEGYDAHQIDRFLLDLHNKTN